MGDIIYTDKDRRDIFKEVREHDEFNDRLRTKVYTEEELAKLDIVGTDEYFKYEAIEGNILDSYYKGIEVDKYKDTLMALDGCTDEYVAILNFADAYVPGGPVADGAEGQECTLCRSTNLYESLMGNECKDKFYTYNKKLGKASDRIIYTRNVTYLRDDGCFKTAGFTRQCDVITCAAPKAGEATDDDIRRRMKYIINVADENRVNTLILGCWGCGAAGNSWEHFSELWFDVIKELKPNCKIIFATSGNGTRLDLIFGRDPFSDDIDPKTEDDAMAYILERNYNFAGLHDDTVEDDAKYIDAMDRGFMID